MGLIGSPSDNISDGTFVNREGAHRANSRRDRGLAGSYPVSPFGLARFLNRRDEVPGGELKRPTEELDPSTEYPESLGPDRICALGGHVFMLVNARFTCALCGAAAHEGL